MDSTIILQTTLNGLMIGGVYALVAVGLTLIFGVMKIVNFAQGEFVMLGMYVSWALATFVGIGPYPGLLIVAVIMFVGGWLTFKLLIIRIIGKSDEAFILLTLGLSIFLQNITLLAFGADYLTVTTTVKDAAIRFGGLAISLPRLIAFGVALVMVAALTLFLNRTDTGRAMRATAESREVATLLGIDPVSCFAVAFGVGTVMAGIAGVLLTPMFYVYPGVGTLFNTTAFIVVVLGGMGSLTGALVGGLLIGIVEALGGTFVSLDLSQLFAFLIFLAVLFVRPSGLFGRSA
ncbi:branched-chain amino acid ABC transporter permease [Rhodoplanes sp.]|uniref:branched-chain amino acid ABC transporter permease n=1 Tax=Rhodoplanes sp. TaxID=1968906 RepID=UPI0025D45552|nr:branched-chain amino acid ABC transporter permease [Rhodoplanes sp.]